MHDWTECWAAITQSVSGFEGNMRRDSDFYKIGIVEISKRLEQGSLVELATYAEPFDNALNFGVFLEAG